MTARDIAASLFWFALMALLAWIEGIEMHHRLMQQKGIFQ